MKTNHHRPDPDRVRAELGEGDEDGNHEADGEAGVGNETDEAGDDADQQARTEPDQKQAGGVEDAQDQTGQHLAAHEGGDLAIHLVGEGADLVGVVARQEVVDAVTMLSESRAGRRRRMA